MKKLLLVDRIPNNLKILTEIFNKKYTLIESDGTAEIFNIIKQNESSLLAIIFDVAEPSEIEIVKGIINSEITADIPLIVISDESVSEIDALNTGVWDYISRFDDPEVIFLRVENTISKFMLMKAAAKKAKLDSKNYALNLITDMPAPYILLKHIGNDNLFDNCFVVEFCNKSYAKLYGYDYKELTGTMFTEFNEEPVLLDLCKRTACNKGSGAYTTIELKKDNRVYSISIYSPKNNCCSLIFNDVTNTKHIQKEYIDALVRENQLLTETNKQRELYEFIANQTGAAVFEWNIGDNKIYSSGNLTPYPWQDHIKIDSLHNLKDIKLVHPEDMAPLFMPFVNGIIKGEKLVQTTLRVKNDKGDFMWCKIIASCFHDDNGKLIRIIATVKDVNQEIEYLSHLKKNAEFDLLTGLYNRNTFYMKVKKLIEAYPKNEFSLVCFDINKFKLINGIFGRNEGDKLLVSISQKLTDMLANCQYSLCGRFDADVFCICLPTSCVDEYVNYIEHLLEDYKINFDIVISLGIYNIVNKSISVDIMCDKARLALSKIKGNYLIRHIFFDEKMNEILINEQEIVNDMNRAISERQFIVNFQPHYQLSTYKLRGAEALVRWLHPTKGMIYPNEFIPLFERNGFIMKLDEYVWENVCIFLKRRLDEGKPIIPISVNVSKVNIYNPRLSEIIISLIDKYNIPPNLFQVEITESAYTDNKSSLIEVIKKWQAKGIVVMMDDFGSGYSSLNILKDISVDVLKMDLKFLDSKDENGKGKSIMSSVIRMAKWLNMYVVAEGVETKEQVDFLRNIGCEYAQGYFFSKPIPMDEFEKLLNENQNTKALKDVSIEGCNYDFMKTIWLNEARTNLIFNNITCAMGIYELCNNRIEAICLNDEYFRIHGISRESFSNIEIHILDWIIEEDRNKALKLFQKSFSNNGFSEGTVRKRLPNGKRIHLKLTIKFIMGDSKNGVYFATLTDVTNEKLIEKKLDETNLEMAMLLQTTPTAVVKLKYAVGLPILYANDFFYSVLGYTRESYCEKNGNNLEPVIPLSSYNEITTEFSNAINRHENKLFTRIKALASDGSYRHFMSGNGFIYGADDVKIISTDLDITDLVNKEQKLQEVAEQLKQHNLKLNEKYIRERQLREVVSANSMIYCEIDLDADVLLDGYEINMKRAGVSVGDGGSKFLTRISDCCIYHEDKEAFEGVINIKNLLYSYKTGIYNIKQELRLNLSANDGYKWVEIITTIFESDINGHICCTITGKDISDSKKYEQALIEKSEKDPLTGLFNTVRFKKAVSEHINKYKNGTFYMLDIDNFKLINDRYGHCVGDNLIISVSHALTNSLPQNAIIARTGGDEYAAFIGIDMSRSKAIEYAEIICNEIRNKAPDKSMSDSLTCSLGVSICFDSESCNYDRLYANADKAMYLAKQSGKNKYVFYENPSIKKEIKIIIADDRNIRRTVISRLLTDKYNVIETISGLTCIEKAHEHGSSITAIILDSTFPDLSGLSVLEELKKDDILSKIPVIMLTKTVDTELKRKARLLGVEYFIDKPIDSDLILKYIEDIVKKPTVEAI